MEWYLVIIMDTSQNHYTSDELNCNILYKKQQEPLNYCFWYIFALFIL
jgi:hypothetical protein